MTKKYVITFGKSAQPTQHQFDTKIKAMTKVKKLGIKLPYLKFKVRKISRI